MVSPLMSLMKDQVRCVTFLGIRAVALAKVSSDLQSKAVKNGEFSIIFALPELQLGDQKWRAQYL